MKVLFISFTKFDNINRGSALRPYKIYNSFVDKGYEVLLINGNNHDRRKKFQEYKNANELDDIDYCYIEPSTYPCHPLDFQMFVHLKTKKIPIGLFYRDMYHKFPELFNYTGIKNAILQFRYDIDWQFYKRISKVIFFPSATMANYFKFNNKVSLPPAGDLIDVDRKKIKNSVIYVGGISKEFGTDILLEALDKVNAVRPIKLILVCRTYNAELFDQYSNSEWLEIKHLSGDDLKNEYNNSDMAIIPRPITKYNDLAVPIKLFEYLSYGMPVVSTKTFETTKVIEDNKVGITVEGNSEDLAKSILELYQDTNSIFQYSENALEMIRKHNTWKNRVEKIEKELLK